MAMHAGTANKQDRRARHAMSDTGLTPEWFAQVRADTVYRSRSGREIDHEFLDLMRRAGCRTVMCGLESVSDAGLARLGKQACVADSERAVAAFHDHGIGVHGMFVLGLDSDTRSSARDTVAAAIMRSTAIPGAVGSVALRPPDRRTCWRLTVGAMPPEARDDAVSASALWRYGRSGPLAAWRVLAWSPFCCLLPRAQRSSSRGAGASGA